MQNVKLTCPKCGFYIETEISIEKHLDELEYRKRSFGEATCWRCWKSLFFEVAKNKSGQCEVDIDNVRAR